VSFAERDRSRERRELVRRRRARLLALGGLVGLIAGLMVAIAVATSGGGRSATSASTASLTATTGSSTSHSTASTATTTASPGRTAVPILLYHVINSAPASTNSPQLYVPVSEFTAQMQALKAAGWHAVTLDRLEAYWAHGTPLGTRKPIVVSFDNGYASQYNNALPVLKQLGWVGVVFISVNGLPTSEGGISDSQIRGLVSAGWEIDSEGMSAPDLTALGTSSLQTALTGSRQTLQSTYGVHANWLAYPGGHYNPTVTAAVKSAGYTGGLTSVAGWASGQENLDALPRLTVAPGTSASALLQQIAAARSDSAPGTSG
jgi:peptidoglycan/xylan/chitin deacetylase (PgdA/CDA1 family)